MSVNTSCDPSVNQGRQEPGSEAADSSLTQHDNYLLKGETDLADKIFGAIAAISGPLSGIAYNFHYNLAGTTLLANTIFCIIAILYFHVSLHLGRKERLRTSWSVGVLATTIFFLTAVSASVVLIPKIFPQKLAPPPMPAKQFNVAAGLGWLSIRLNSTLSTNGLGRLALGTQLPGKVILKPIDWMIYVTLANNQDIPTRIEGYYGLSEKHAKKVTSWRFPCRVSLEDGLIYFLNHKMTDVSLIGTSKAIDRRLTEQTIAPHDSVSGWMAFECPNAQCGTLTKLSIREANGRVSETDPFPLSSTSSPLHDSWPETIAVHQDLSGTSIEVKSSCDSPGDTGLFGLFPER